MSVLTSWGRWSISHWRLAFALAAVITAVMIYGISLAEPQMTFYSILPKNEKNVQDLKEIVAKFPLASGVIAVIDGRGIKDPAEAKERVEETIDAISGEFKKQEYKPYIVNTIGKMDMSLFKEHGLMLLEEDDIRRFAKMYSSLELTPLLRNINSDFEREYSDEEKLSDDETLAANQFNGLNTILELVYRAAEGKKISGAALDNALDQYMFGESYLLSNDNRMGLLIVEPAFTMEDIPLMTEGVDVIEKEVKRIADANGLKGGVTGLTVVGRDEMATSGKGLAGSSIIALILILSLMIFTFRMFSAPLISGIPLIIGIMWTIGMAGFIIHRLNIITAMYMIVLLGLGIDYAIHLLTSFVQERDDGAGFEDAVIKALEKSGSGIIIGALTTAAAFFMLMTAKTDMVSELGIVAGIGILSELVSMLMLIPPILSFRNYRKIKKGKSERLIFRRVNFSANAASGVGRFLVRFPLIIAVVMILVITGFSFYSGRVSVETNIMEMEAKGLESIRLQDEMTEEFGMAPDGLSVIENNLKEVKLLSKKLEKLSSVKRVESIAPYVVTEEERNRRLGEIQLFRSSLENMDNLKKKVNRDELLNELYRLEDNFLEISDLAFLGNMDKLSTTLSKITGRNNDGEKIRNTYFDGLYSLLENNSADLEGISRLQYDLKRRLRERLLGMSSPDMVGIDMVPNSIRDSYVSKDGKSFLLSIVPTKNPWKEEFRNIYTAQIKTVTDKATGMVLAGDQLSTMARVDGVRASIAAVIAIFIILLIDFRNLKLVIITMIPLAASFVVLFGMMGILGIKFDFVNIIAVPLLIGIGIDDAVHINHRYLLEGRGSMSLVIGKTGTALLLTSLTTIIGFASFIPSPMRAMKSTGIVLSLAMAIAFINSVLLHPSIIILMTEKLKLSISPWKISSKGDSK